MRKKALCYLLAAAILTAPMTAVKVAAPVTASADSGLVVAFPGAEGAGKYATGGRGGTVYHVTNLNDSGTGSFRDAVSASNRIVVFDVGGTIELKSDVVCKGNVTVAGQTAPGGGGITLSGYKIGMGGDNIIVRYISSRPGERGSGEYDAWGGSAGSNSIVDHCSIGWANDEQWGLYSNNMNQTVQYSIIGPSNCISTHAKGAHGFGIMFGKGNNSWHHNMIAHNISRNFRGKVVGTYGMDFVNNVMYDWGYQTAYGTLGHLNYVGNYLKRGPSTVSGNHFIAYGSGSGYENFKFYVEGNKLVNLDDTDYSADIVEDNWNGISGFDAQGYTEDVLRSSEPMEVYASNSENVSVATTAQTADEAYETVLQYAGAGISAETRPKIDQEVMEEARTGTGSLTGGRDFSTVTDSDQLAAIEKYGILQADYESYYPEATSIEITDTDNDGMPDEWELARGLDPTDASDATGDYLGEGYNNIEYYINDLTIDSFPEGVVTLSATTTDLGEDYQNAKEDAAAISLSPTSITQASDLTLPTTGSVHGSSIACASSSSAVTVKNNQITNVNRPSSGNVTATLTASVTSGDYTVKKNFSITVVSTAVSWKASSSDVGKTAGSVLMTGLTNMSVLTGSSLDSSVAFGDEEYSYYVSGADNGAWTDGAATGTAFSYTASEDGWLTAYIVNLGETKSAYITKAGASDYKTESEAVISGADGAEQQISARVKSGETYYVYVAGSKGRFVGISFDINAPTVMWKASVDAAAGDVLMKGLTPSEDMTYTEKNNMSIDGIDFTGCIAGTTNPSDNGASGAALGYTAEESGTLTVYYKIGSGKTFHINTADGTDIETYINEDESSEYTSTSAVIESGTYYAYVAGSKAEFYGVSFTPASDSEQTTPTTAPSVTTAPTATPTPTAAPTATPEVYTWKATAAVSAGEELMKNLVPMEDMSYKDADVTIDSESFSGYIVGSTNPAFDENGAVTGGAALKYTPDSDGLLTVYMQVGAPSSSGANKVLYITDENGETVAQYENTSGEAGDYSLTAEIEAGKTYYMYVRGSKARMYGVTFTATAASADGVSASVSGTELTITSDREFTAKVITAQYGTDGILTDAAVIDCSIAAGTTTVTVDVNHTTFMIWEDMTPACDAVTR